MPAAHAPPSVSAHPHSSNSRTCDLPNTARCHPCNSVVPSVVKPSLRTQRSPRRRPGPSSVVSRETARPGPAPPPHDVVSRACARTIHSSRRGRRPHLLFHVKHLARAGWAASHQARADDAHWVTGGRGRDLMHRRSEYRHSHWTPLRRVSGRARARARRSPLNNRRSGRQLTLMPAPRKA